MALMKNCLASTRAGVVAMMVAISGCSVAQPPIEHTPNIVASPRTRRVGNQCRSRACRRPGNSRLRLDRQRYRGFARSCCQARCLRSMTLANASPLSHPVRRPGRPAAPRNCAGAIQSAAVSGVGGAALGAAAGAVALAGAAGNARQLLALRIARRRRANRDRVRRCMGRFPRYRKRSKQGRSASQCNRSRQSHSSPKKSARTSP